MSWLARVAAQLETHNVRFAVIGASAMAVHGVSRSTMDVDLLTMDRRVLEETTWSELTGETFDLSIRRGDFEDPLAGVVRARASGERSVDLIVGKAPWQAELVEQAPLERLGDLELPVVHPSGLILLKVYAGGPQDAWDIHQLLATDDRAGLVRQVDSRIHELDARARDLWFRLRDE